MEYGICTLSAVPVRAEPSDKSELTTELFFGECYEIIQKEGNWYHIRIAADGYTGWMDFKQHFSVTEAYYKEWVAENHPRSLDLVQTISNMDSCVPVLMGSTLPFFDGINIRIGEERYLYNGRASNPHMPLTQTFMNKVVLTYLKAPYVWGGKSPFGIDCSGFVQQVYGMFGVKLPRDAYQQVAFGKEVHFVSQTKPGDLAFFDNEEGRIIHVGILLDNQQIIHAHGEVRVDPLDHQGIYNTGRKRYSHKLRIIKRIID